jgi:hypothetical protein
LFSFGKGGYGVEKIRKTGFVPVLCDSWGSRFTPSANGGKSANAWIDSTSVVESRHEGLMGWILDRWKTLSDATGWRRLAVGGTIGGVLNAFNIIASAVGWSPLSVGTTIAIAVATFFGLLFWWVLNHATGLRIELEPRILVSFDPCRDGLVESPIRHPNTPDIIDHAKYVKLCVECLSTQSINKCTAGLSKIEKKTDSGELHTVWDEDTLDLRWSRTGSYETVINKLEKKYVWILEVQKSTGIPRFSAVTPLRADSQNT